MSHAFVCDRCEKVQRGEPASTLHIHDDVSPIPKLCDLCADCYGFIAEELNVDGDA